MHTESESKQRRWWRRPSTWIVVAAGTLLATTQLHSQVSPAETQRTHDRTSQTIVLPTAALEDLKQPIEEGTIDFALLREAELHDESPPVFPEALARLDGQVVRIKGFMVPFDDVKDLSKFMLMPSSGGCFFCQPPSVTEVLYVEQVGAQKNEYIKGLIEVEGTLRLWKPDSKLDMHQAFLFLLLEAHVRTIK